MVTPDTNEYQFHMKLVEEHIDETSDIDNAPVICVTTSPRGTTVVALARIHCIAIPFYPLAGPSNDAPSDHR